MSRVPEDLPPGFPLPPSQSNRQQDTPEPPPPDRRVTIGQVVKAHGLKGDLKVQPATWRPERFADLDSFWLEGTDGRVHYLTPKRLRIEPGAVFIRFREAPVREFAEPLVGGRIFIDEAERDALPEDLYYVDDLTGCTVIDSEHGEIGTITDVMDMPANDVWQVNGPRGEILIPAIREVVDEIDVENKRVHVTLLEGLIPDQQDDTPDPEKRGRGRKSTRSRHGIQRPQREDPRIEPSDDH